jgi:LysM repeat protein
LNALRHEKTYEQKFETQAARRAESLHQYSGFVNTCKNNRSGGEPACQINVPVAKFRWDESNRYFLRNKLFRALDCFCGESRAARRKISGVRATWSFGKKEQNAKIDALSQEILKLEQQLSHARPGVMIGEAAPAPATAAAPAASPSHSPVEGNAHTVARGETLTSIAKMYKVTVDDLQKANHIEDGRKLQAGQTIIIPTASPAASGSPSP